MVDPQTAPAPQPDRILIRSVNWLGDAVMTLPALQRIRQRFPRAQITVFSPGKLRDLWDFCPAVDEALAFGLGSSCFHSASQLRGGKFDLALVLPNSPRSALECWLAGIPRRVGYARPWRNWFLSTALPPRPDRGQMRKRSTAEVHRLIGSPAAKEPTLNSNASTPQKLHQMFDYLHLAAALGADPTPAAPQLRVQPAETASARSHLFDFFKTIFGQTLTTDTIFLGVAPSAAYGPAKRWPIENFSQVLRQTAPKLKNAVWVAFGTVEDRALCEELAAGPQPRVLNLAGETSLKQLASSLALCRLLLTNDSGPMHLAAALGVRVIVPFGSTSPDLTGPGLPGDSRHRVLSAHTRCSPCFRRTCPIEYPCLRGITPEDASKAVLELALTD